MSSRQTEKKGISVGTVIYWLILVDLIWGGTGRVITVGPVSFRILLCGIALLLEIITAGSGGKHATGITVGLILTVDYLCINTMLSILYGNNVGYVLDEATGYLVIAIVPFFHQQFARDNSLAKKTVTVAYNLLLLFSLFSIALWLYSYYMGPGSYESTRAILDKYVFGSVTFIGSIPRVFLKSSVLLPFGLLISIDRILNGQGSIKNVMSTLAFVLAILSTFTVGFYVFTLFVSLMLLLSSVKENTRISARSILFFLFAVVITVFILGRTSIVETMAQRFQGDYTFSYKESQAIQLLDSWSERPLLGHGFGATVQLEHAYKSTVAYRFEIMWLQLLHHGGMIGFLIFTGYVVSFLRDSFRLSKVTSLSIYRICGLFLLFLCLESFTNPFMNNTIGLIPFCIIAGKVGLDGSRLLEKPSNRVGGTNNLISETPGRFASKLI